MKFLLDTNIIIDHLRRRMEVRDFLRKLLLDGSIFYCCDIIVTEVIAGMRPSEERMTNGFLSDFEYIDIRYPIAYQAGKIKYSLERKGVTVSTTDALIAALAQSYDMTLVTNDKKGFLPIDGLKMISL